MVAMQMSSGTLLPFIVTIRSGCMKLSSRCIKTATRSVSKHDKMLVRDFLRLRTSGSNCEGMSVSVAWKDLWTEAQYRKKCQDLRDTHGYVSPCSLFAPQYSASIACYMMSERQSEKLRILELVTGSSLMNSLHLLNYLQSDHPDIYKDMEYVALVGSNDQLLFLEQTTKQLHPFVQILNHDPANLLSLPASISNQSWFILAMEYMSTLPHDKVIRSPTSIQSSNRLPVDQWKQIMVGVTDNGTAIGEVEEAVNDNLIKDTIALCLSEDGYMQMSGAGTRTKSMLSEIFNPSSTNTYLRMYSNTAFLPTLTLQLLKSLQLILPHHRAILIDYDSFIQPTVHQLQKGSLGEDGSLHALNAPIVNSTNCEGDVIDHLSYLMSSDMHKVEVQFPIDFDVLQRMYAGVTLRSSTHIKQGDFLKAYCPDVKSTRTKFGFNPLITDFSNMSVLLS